MLRSFDVLAASRFTSAPAARAAFDSSGNNSGTNAFVHDKDEEGHSPLSHQQLSPQRQSQSNFFSAATTASPTSCLGSPHNRVFSFPSSPPRASSAASAAEDSTSSPRFHTWHTPGVGICGQSGLFRSQSDSSFCTPTTPPTSLSQLVSAACACR